MNLLPIQLSVVKTNRHCQYEAAVMNPSHIYSDVTPT